MISNLTTTLKELKEHAPYTILGSLSGIVILLLVVLAGWQSSAAPLFEVLHPVHVLCSALVTAGMYKLHNKTSIWKMIVVGYVGSIGIATLSDCVIPFAGEWMMNLPHRGVHIGFIEHWAVVNPLAFLGIAIAWVYPTTKFPHAIHVWLSTWASLFHMIMALGQDISMTTMVLIPIFLFLAVWVPCCTSDIVFPLLLTKKPLGSKEEPE
ncbi:MAG: hypothetical protein GXP32_10570 [Kiritimatiellaeota bacterium]|nr:hypothetical protein [Kiritimatiellota bacterium]